MKSSEVRKQCLGCGVDFSTFRDTQKFCSNRCKMVSLNKNKREGTLAPNFGNRKGLISKKDLYEMYIIKKESTKTIGQKFKLNPQTVANRLHEFGIPTRKSYEVIIEKWNERKVLPAETKRKISENASLRIGEKNPFYGKHHTEQTKHKIGEANKGRHHSEESKKRMSIMRKGKPHSEEHKRKMVMLWKKPEYKERCLKAIIKGMFKRPTSLENQFMEFIQKHNLPYKYVGNGEFLIGFKNPDFVNVNGEKICIDVRSKEVCKYFSHQTPMEYEKQRIEHFAKYGWKCVVILAERNNKRNWKFYKSNKEILHFLEPIDGIKTNGGIL